MVEAMYVAAGVGQVIANRAFLAGASGGCQAEIGSGSAMAAAAICHVCGADVDTMGHAAAMALKNLMGLVCDRWQAWWKSLRETERGRRGQRACSG